MAKSAVLLFELYVDFLSEGILRTLLAFVLLTLSSCLPTYGQSSKSGAPVLSFQELLQVSTGSSVSWSSLRGKVVVPSDAEMLALSEVATAQPESNAAKKTASRAPAPRKLPRNPSQRNPHARNRCLHEQRGEPDA